MWLTKNIAPIFKLKWTILKGLKIIEIAFDAQIKAMEIN